MSERELRAARGRRPEAAAGIAGLEEAVLVVPVVVRVERAAAPELVLGHAVVHVLERVELSPDGTGRGLGGYDGSVGRGEILGAVTVVLERDLLLERKLRLRPHARPTAHDNAIGRAVARALVGGRIVTADARRQGDRDLRPDRIQLAEAISVERGRRPMNAVMQRVHPHGRAAAIHLGSVVDVPVVVGRLPGGEAQVAIRRPELPEEVVVVRVRGIGIVVLAALPIGERIGCDVRVQIHEGHVQQPALEALGIRARRFHGRGRVQVELDVERVDLSGRGELSSGDRHEEPCRVRLEHAARTLSRGRARPRPVRARPRVARDGRGDSRAVRGRRHAKSERSRRCHAGSRSDGSEDHDGVRDAVDLGIHGPQPHRNAREADARLVREHHRQVHGLVGVRITVRVLSRGQGRGSATWLVHDLVGSHQDQPRPVGVNLRNMDREARRGCEERREGNCPEEMTD